MSDLTPFFVQCCSIVQRNLGFEVKNEFDVEQTTKNAFKIEDTFIKECHEFYELLTELEQFVQEIKSPYLAMNDESNLNSGTSLSLEEKNKIDEEFNYKIQQMYQKLKHLQNYENKRQSIDTTSKGSGWLSWLGDDESSDHQLWTESIGSHRTNILRFLNSTINYVNKQFDDMNRKRIERDRTLALLDFPKFEEDEDLNNFNQSSYFHDLEDNQIIIQQDEDENDTMQLSQQQIQEFEAENKEFLNMKTNQLKQVEKLHSSMVDIINLQAELSFQLETQGEQINNLLDNQSQVEVDVRLGNKTLNQARKRNTKGANILITLSLVFAFLLLFVDYISF